MAKKYHLPFSGTRLEEILTRLNEILEGNDGALLSVDVTPTETGYSVSLTHANGTDIIELTNGTVPVKGVDYWTDEDINMLVNEILSALPKWTGGSY